MSALIDVAEFARSVLVLSLVVATMVNGSSSIRKALCCVWLLLTLLIIIGGAVERHRSA